MSGKIKLLAPGPIKFPFIKEGLKYYLNKLEPLTKIEFFFPKIKHLTSSKQERLDKEKKILEKFISSKDFLIVLDERGEFLKINELVSLFEKIWQNSYNICFLVGGPEGLSEDLKKQAHKLLSLSSLTLNHEVVLLVLAEAIYRSLSILKGFPYHRD